MLHTVSRAQNDKLVQSKFYGAHQFYDVGADVETRAGVCVCVYVRQLRRAADRGYDVKHVIIGI